MRKREIVTVAVMYAVMRNDMNYELRPATLFVAQPSQVIAMPLVLGNRYAADAVSALLRINSRRRLGGTEIRPAQLAGVNAL